jgi:superkiller protein 3
LRRARWDEADGVLAQAAQQLDEAGETAAPERGKHEELRAALALGRRLDELRAERLVQVEGNTLEAALPALYRTALAEHGLDVDAGEAGALGSAVAASPVRELLVAALDDWAVLEADAARRGRLLAAARQADPGPWPDRFRDPRVRADRKALEELAAQADPETTPAGAVAALGALLEKAGADPIPLLRRAQGRHPEDFWLCFGLGVAISKLDPGRQVEAAAMFEAARALRPDSVQVKNNLGNALSIAGDPRRGEALLREVVRDRPDFVAGWYNLAVTLYNLGRLDEARAAVERATESLEKGATPPEDAPYIYNTLGLVLEYQGDTAGAATAYRKGAGLGDRRPRLLLNLGWRLINEGERREAEATLRQAIEAADAAIRHNPRDAWAWMSRGAARHVLQDFPAASADLREAVRLWPTSAYAWRFLGNSLYAQAKTAESEAALLRAVELLEQQGQAQHPELAELYETLGTISKDLGKMRQAIDYARRATQIGPQHAWAWGRLADHLSEAGDPPEARKAAEEAVRRAEASLRRQPDHMMSLFHLGKARRLLGQFAEAAQAMRKCVGRDPSHPWAREELSEGLWRWGTPAALAEAHAVLEEGLRRKPDHAMFHYNLCVVARRLGRLDEAVRAGREALRLQPQNVNTQIVLANALGARGDLEEAVALYRQVQAARPTYHFAPLNLSQSLFDLGRFYEAVAEAHRAVTLAPENVTAHVHLMGRRQAIGDTPGALLAARKALAAGNVSPAQREGLAAAATALEAALADDPRAELVLGPTVFRAERVTRLTGLYERLEEVLAGKAQPRDADETLRLARLAFAFARRHAAAARLYAEAFDRGAKRADDLAAMNRLVAGLSALQGALGPGVDTPAATDHPERKKLRTQALAWLRAELTAREAELAAGGARAAQARGALTVLKQFDAVRALREASVQQQLPPAERPAWQQLLADLDRLLAPPPMPRARD